MQKFIAFCFLYLALTFALPFLFFVMPDGFFLSMIVYGVPYVALVFMAFCLYEVRAYNHLLLLLIIIICGLIARNIIILVKDSFLLVNYVAPLYIEIIIKSVFHTISVVIAFFCVRRHAETIMNIDFSFSLIAIVLMTMVIVGTMNVFTETLKNNDVGLYLLFLLWHILVCVALLILLLMYTRKYQSEHDATVAKLLWEEDRKQFKAQQDNIEIINIKCHDLRYQLDHEEETKRAISEYDASYHTGNKVLDVVLSDKSMRCLLKKIEFSCMVDGESISFMDENDIFSFFNNALDNAIEYEETIDEEKRFISVVIKRNGEMVVIRLENRFEGDLVLVNGLPKTTKKDKAFHGFGTKSMERIVKKYDGTLSISNESGVFTLVAMFFNGNQEKK
ncbi:MAG: sensor histidine kinase [Bacilli bacterium]|nr:sensor histidine kinase [Bacilli bacterium]